MYLVYNSFIFIILDLRYPYESCIISFRIFLCLYKYALHGNQLSVVGSLVSKETVVLRRWERWKQKFGFIERVDKDWITTVKDLESWRFER